MLKKLSSFFLLTTVVLPFSLSSCGNKTNIVSDSFNLNYFNKFNPTKNKYFHKFPTRDYTTGIYSGATNDQNMIKDLKKNLNKYFIISGMLSTFYKYYLDISSQETISTFNLQVSYVFNNFSIKDYKFSAFIHSETIEYLNYEFQIPFISCSIIDAMYADFDGEGWNIPLSIIGNKDYETISFIDFHSNDSEDPIFLYTSSSPFPFNTYEFANVTLPIGTIPE